MKLYKLKLMEVPRQFSLFASKEAIKLNWTGAEALGRSRPPGRQRSAEATAGFEPVWTPEQLRRPLAPTPQPEHTPRTHIHITNCRIEIRAAMPPFNCSGAVNNISQSECQGGPHGRLTMLRFLIASYPAICYKDNCLPANQCV